MTESLFLRTQLKTGVVEKYLFTCQKKPKKFCDYNLR